MRPRRKAPESRADAALLRAIFCLLLTGLLLYNPFVSLVHSPAGLSVHHLSRNRATVGSGELQHFSPVERELAADFLPAECSGERIIDSGGQGFQLASVLTRDRVTRPDFSSNLWFRPPPSA